MSLYKKTTKRIKRQNEKIQKKEKGRLLASWSDGCHGQPSAHYLRLIDSCRGGTSQHVLGLGDDAVGVALLEAGDHVGVQQVDTVQLVAEGYPRRRRKRMGGEEERKKEGKTNKNIKF
jgi:hypothetical protein